MAASRLSRLSRPPAVARVLRQVAETARREDMLLPGTTILAAVSGGPDSTCLLHALARLRRLFRIEVVCAHVDHGLRPESGADAAYARRQAERLGVPFHVRAVASRPPRGASVEAWARTERYTLLREVAARVGAARIAVGHTQDDRAETLLLALLRGGGLDALAGMRPVREEVVRPLIDVSRADVESFCRALRLRPRRDRMNEDPSFLRSAIRTRVLPEIERATGRGVRAALARTAAALEADARLLEADAERAAGRLLARRGGEVVLALAPLAALPEPIAARVVRRALVAAGAEPTLRAAARIRALAQGPLGSEARVAPDLYGRREGSGVRLHWRST